MNSRSIAKHIFTRSSVIISILCLIYCLMMGPVGGVSWAQDFPTKEIKLVVPLNPGGSVDIPTRLFADKLEKILGVPLVVTNNAAGGGVVGCVSVAQAKTDGYTLLSGPTGHIILKPLLVSDLPYRHTDFTPICQIIVMPVVILVNGDAPWKTLKEFIDYGRKNPGKLRASVGTAGGFLQIITDLFKAEAKVDITDIPTQGGVSQVAALMGGHAELCTDTFTSSGNADFLRSGRVRGLVSTHKVPGFPGIKTFEEEGYPRVNMKMWNAIFGPKALPKPIVTRLSNAFEKACNDPSLRDQLEKMYIIPDYKGPEETARMIESERDISFKLFKQSGLIK
jgi:tripartite-type tricarboxylate transporter receptor subunit TctC